nr:zinc finger BED domain-containing protein RICESLEEPER 2-like [Ipomoea trifida]
MVTLVVDPPLVQQPLLGLAVSYHESNWTPEYDLPPSQVWTLQPCLLHESFTDTFPSLGKRILDSEVSWSKHLKFDGEFSFTKCYWEWAEDILNHFGKVLKKWSIYDAVYASLFTYDCNTSIIQAFLRRMVPTNEYLSDITRRSDHLTSGLAHSWWITPTWRSRYQVPPARKETKGRRSRPKATYNPSGVIDAFEGWSSVSDAPFVTLGIPRIQEEEIYLAAFLACWLCVFVLPSTPSNAIRSETFRMACIMAQGRRVYEIEKKKLKNNLESVSKVSLTTDCWKSKNQKIEYMIVTRHWIDSSWKLQKRVLSFINIPPPRGGLQISDAIFKCMKEWVIERKVFTITVDNATSNDSAIRLWVPYFKFVSSRSSENQISIG